VRSPKSLKREDKQIPFIPCEDCLAKSYNDSRGLRLAGRNVTDHCLTVGLVAREILSRFPKHLRQKIFPCGAELVAAAHDVGKVSPTFQLKIFRSVNGKDALIPSGIPPHTNPDHEKCWSYHGGVSQASVAMMEAGSYIPKILGQHHGYEASLGGRLGTDECFGGVPWQVQRNRLVGLLKQGLGVNDWPNVSDHQALALAGLTSVSDWIGSGPDFDDPSRPAGPMISKAVDHAGFIMPSFHQKMSFKDIFGF